MRSPGSTVLSLVALACCGLVSGQQGLAAIPAFTITATNVTLTSGNSGTDSQLAITAANGYSGVVGIQCQYAGSTMDAKPPTCGGGPQRAYQLTSGQTSKGTLAFYPYGVEVPAAKNHPHGMTPGLSLASVLSMAVIGIFGIRTRKPRNWLWLMLFGVISVCGFASCGGNGLSGTYPFTVTAFDIKTSAAATTTVMVTVP